MFLLITLELLVGNLLLSCETNESIKFSLDDVLDLKNGLFKYGYLGQGSFTQDDLRELCDGKFRKICKLDNNGMFFMRSRGWPDLTSVNKDFDERDLIFVESYVRWFVAKRFRITKQTTRMTAFLRHTAFPHVPFGAVSHYQVLIPYFPVLQCS